jgi:RHS repeat-associated protein
MTVRNFVAQATEPENWVWSVANTRWEDGSGNPISHGTDFDQNIISTTTYNKAGQVVSSRDARGTQTSFSYDDAGRRLTVAQAVGTSLETLSYTGYDKAGRVRRSIQNYVPDGVNNPDEQNDDGDWLFAPTSHGTDNDQNRITEYIYDAASRRTEVMDPLGNVQETAYRKDGQVESMTNADDKVTRYRYDARNRRTLVVQNHQDNSVDPEQWIWSSANSQWEDGSSNAIIHGTENDQNIIVQVGYDLAGRMISLRDPRGNETTYEYDRLGRRTKLTNPLSVEWLTAYQEVAQANRTVMTYPGLATGGSYDVTRTFDKMGRLKEIDYGDPTSTPTVNFTHDILGNRLTMEEIGASSQTVRETIFGYDAANRLNQVEFDSDGDSSVEDTLAYSYDQGGLRTQLTINGSLTIGYEYDEKGQLIKLTDWDSQETDFSYDDAGRHILTQRPNDVESVYSYDVAGRLAQITHQDVSGTPDVLAEYIYTVNELGNRTQAVEKIKSGGSLQQTTIDYTYDALQRLIEADYDSGSTVYDYGYDVAGNLVNNNGVTRTYNAANQMVNDGTNPLTYDANGNLTATDYGWDRANRMVSAPGSTAYAYDGLGNRVQQTVSSVVTDYLLDVQPGLVKVLRETTGAISNHYIHGPRGIHAQLVPGSGNAIWGQVNWGSFVWGGSGGGAAEWQYLLQDGLGSVRAVADDSAALTQTLDFSPYGVPQGSYGTGFGFTGEYNDANDLLYLRARYYAPEMGVFTGLDPWEGKTCTPMSLNGYSWVEGNVVNAIDPMGQIPTPDDIKDYNARYSCRCGWIDYKHIREAFGYARLIREAISRPIEGDYLNGDYRGLRIFKKNPTGLANTDTYHLLPLSFIVTNTMEDVVLGIQMYQELEQEEVQKRYELLSRLATLVGERPSGFAEEDLPSNRLGHYIWRENQHLENVDNSKIEEELSVCGILDEVASLWMYYEYKQGVPDYLPDYGLFSLDWHESYRRPRPDETQFLRASDCGDESWPSQFLLTPVEHRDVSALSNWQINYDDALYNDRWLASSSPIRISLQPWELMASVGNPNSKMVEIYRVSTPC